MGEASSTLLPRRAPAGAPIACADELRTPGELQPWDLEGVEGRWLEVPRLQQQNGAAPAQSSFWSGRAAAAMLHNFRCKFERRTDEYIAHAFGEPQPGPNGVALNLRWLGGPHRGELAGVVDGRVELTQIFRKAGMKIAAGTLVKPGAALDPQQAGLHFAPIVEELRRNNPVLLFTMLSRGPGHVVVVSGFKLASDGALWLRITDPDAPRGDYLRDFEPVTNPVAPDRLFSEYWLPAAALLALHPTLEGARLFEHAGSAGKFLYVLPEPAIPDEDELVHWLTPRAPAVLPASASPASSSPSAPGANAKPAPKKLRPLAELEAALLAGKLKDAGKFGADGFADPELNALLLDCCREDGLAPAVMGDRGGRAGANAPGIRGGELELSTDATLPNWYCVWRVKVSQRPRWDTWCAVRAKLGEAWSRWHFRELCARGGADYPASADEYFAQLWKSNGNGKSGELGGPGPAFSASSASLAFVKARRAAGERLEPGKGTLAAEQVLLGGLREIAPAAGDVLSIVSAGGPRSGHVVTLLMPLAPDWNSGSLWVVSGNAAPRGTIAVDLLRLEAREVRFNPFKPGADGAPLREWQEDETRPSGGRVWVYADERCSLLLPRLEKKAPPHDEGE